DPRVNAVALGGGGPRDGAAEPIDDAADRLVRDVRGKVIRSYSRREGRQRGAHRSVTRHRVNLQSVTRKEILLYKLHVSCVYVRRQDLCRDTYPAGLRRTYRCE